MGLGKNFRNIFLIMVSLLMMVTFGGCSSDSRNSILMMGSTALQPLAEEAARQYMNKNSGTNIQVQGGGSGNGLTAVSQGAAQIGNSDIFAEEKQGIDAKALEDHEVCVVGDAIIANPGVGIDNITKSQLIGIFTGKVTNWSQIGGADVPVVVINRPAGSGTRVTFKKYALNGAADTAGKPLTQDSSGAVLRTVSDTKGSISYVGLTYINASSTVKVLKLDGVEPTAENIENGKYPVWSYEHMYTKGPASGLAKLYIDFVMSDEAKPIISKMSYISISDMKVKR